MIYNYFLPFSRLLFILLMASFAVQKLFSLLWSHLFIFAFGVRFKKIITKINVKELIPLFSFRSFMVSGLTFKSLTHFELIFVYGVRQWSNFTLLHVAVQFSHHLLKRLSFPQRMFLVPLSSHGTAPPSALW